MHLFLLQKDKCSEFADTFCDDKYLSVDCNPAVIFENVNILNVLQGESDVLTVGEKLLFKRNLWRFCESVAKYNVS